MAELLEYKCPCCGGAIEFDSASQNMKCPYCDTEFDVETLRSLDDSLKDDKGDSMNWTVNSSSKWDDTEAAGMRVYLCESCGGEIVADATMGAMSCPFCGNPVVVAGQFAGDLKPDFIIPFKLDKKAAKEGLVRHLSNKKLLPKIFKDENHIDEVRGIYVPFWLFDSDADAQLRFKGTRVRSWSDRRYHYTETSFYSVQRDGCLGFENVPADGSTKMPDDLMESLEPYDLSEAVDFQTAYMAGYLADKYDVTAEQSVERVNERIKQSVEDTFKSAASKGYASLTLENSSVQITDGRVRYGLYPAWVLNTTWRGEKYTFAMNGQTGKFVGNLPIDKSAYWKYFAIFTAAGTAIFFAITQLARLL